jgi:hypothetical protein
MVAFLKASPSCASPVNREVYRKSTHGILPRCGTWTGGTLRGLEYERYFRIFILQLRSGNDSSFTIRGSTFPEAGWWMRWMLCLHAELKRDDDCHCLIYSWRSSHAEVGPSQCCSPFEQADHREFSWIRMPAAIHSIKVYSLLVYPLFHFHTSASTIHYQSNDGVAQKTNAKARLKPAVLPPAASRSPSTPEPFPLRKFPPPPCRGTRRTPHITPHHRAQNIDYQAGNDTHCFQSFLSSYASIYGAWSRNLVLW